MVGKRTKSDKQFFVKLYIFFILRDAIINKLSFVDLLEIAGPIPVPLLDAIHGSYTT